MSACRYCEAEVVWVQTLEGHRPYEAGSELPPELEVVVLRRHDCPDRRRALAEATGRELTRLRRDPAVRAAALEVECPTCHRPARSSCIDMRTVEIRSVKHPHEARIWAGVRRLEDAQRNADRGGTNGG